MRQGDWLQTYTGKQFYPLDPQPEDIDIQDIAHAGDGNTHPLIVYDATDASDTIAWLLTHLDGNDGRVGLYGVSYGGFYAAVAVLSGHPARPGVVETATPLLGLVALPR